MNERSIFNPWIGKRCNACNDDMPVPKLSICRPYPGGVEFLDDAPGHIRIADDHAGRDLERQVGGREPVTIETVEDVRQQAGVPEQAV